MWLSDFIICKTRWSDRPKILVHLRDKKCLSWLNLIDSCPRFHEGQLQGADLIHPLHF